MQIKPQLTSASYATQVWGSCLQFLQQDLNDSHFSAWIAPLKPRIDGQRFILFAPSDYIIGLITARYMPLIRKTIQRVDPKNNYEVEVALSDFELDTQEIEEVTEGRNDSSSPQVQTGGYAPVTLTATPTASKGNETAHGINSEFTFENFVAGKENQIPYAAAEAISESTNTEDLPYNPFFIYSAVGLGKTHLCHAIGNRILQHNPKSRVLYLSSERFVRDYVWALRNKNIESFQRFYRSLDVLLIDDIHFFANKTQSQEEFFHTFNALLEGSKQIVLTSDRLPKNVNGLDDRLQSRFGWGLSLAMDPPGFEMRVAILQKKATLEGVPLPVEVAEYIAERLIGNVRDLEGALKRLIANSRFMGVEIDIALCNSSLKDILVLQEKIISIENIQLQVCRYYGLKQSAMTSKSRAREVARPRQIAMYLSKQLTKDSLPAIGKEFGGRDHSTVIHAVQNVEQLMLDDVRLESEVQEIHRAIVH